MVFTQAARGTDLGFLVIVITPNHFTPSQTHLPRAAESKQEAITHTGQMQKHTLGQVWVKSMVNANIWKLPVG